MAEIIIRIDEKTLQIETEVEGMKGQGCTAVLDALQEALKMETNTQRLKPEFQYVQGRTPQRRR